MESSDIKPSIEEFKINEEDEKELKKKEGEEKEHFVKLFDAVLQERRENLSNEDIGEGVGLAIDLFRQGISGTCEKEIYNTPKRVIGFFHRYSPLYALKMRRLIVDALFGCDELNNLFHRPSLKIVDIGSGAASGLVGLYSALYEKNFPFQSLEVTAMDYNKEWEPFFYGIIAKLREDNFGNASRLFKEKEMKCSFICVDHLVKESCEDKKYLNEADIIFLKGIVSILKTNDDREKMVANIASAMKPGSLLIYIESPSYAEYFKKELILKRLSLIFQTKKEDPDSDLPSKDCKLPLDSGSASYHTEVVTKSRRDEDDRFYFSTTGVKEYSTGFCKNSNQEIFILVKN